jgi:hypothetical protein
MEIAGKLRLRTFPNRGLGNEEKIRIISSALLPICKPENSNPGDMLFCISGRRQCRQTGKTGALLTRTFPSRGLGNEGK